jgi:hypothetical protein
LKLSKDGWTGLACLAASLVLFASTLGLEDSPLVPIGPGFYPRIVLGVTALLAFLLLVSDLVKKPKSEKRSGADYGAVVLHFLLFGAYVGLLPGLGFRLATFAYVAVANAFMAPPRKPLQWLRVALLAAGTALATYYVFEHYLAVLLPRGRWTDW